MRKVIFTLIALFLVLNSYATIRRLNNNPGVVLVPNLVYADLVTAINEASSGDTIYVEPSITAYAIDPNTFNLTKKLIFIGNGYNIGNNAALITPLPFQTSESTIGNGTGNLNLNSGAANCEFYGITFSLGSCQVNVSNVKFDRCKFNSSVFINSSNNIVQRSFFGTINISVGGTNTSLNNIFTNCIIQTVFGQFAGLFDRCYINSINNFGPFIENCVFANSIINIFSSNPSLTNTFTNCLKIGGTFPNAGINNNIENVSLNNVFIVANPVISPVLDRNFRLSLTSPALATGISGTDIGPFGGPNPYRLSGQPPVPVITNFFLSTTGSTSSGLSGSITIQANN